MNTRIEEEMDAMNAYFLSIPSENIPELSELNKEGFEFDWTDIEEGAEVVAYIYEGRITSLIEFISKEDDLMNYIRKLEVRPDLRNRGLAGNLMAYVAKDSFAKGFDGFMFLISKTALRNFYLKKLGGTRIGNTNRIFFDTVASNKIIKRYWKGENKNDNH